MTKPPVAVTKVLLAIGAVLLAGQGSLGDPAAAGGESEQATRYVWRGTLGVSASKTWPGSPTYPEYDGPDRFTYTASALFKGQPDPIQRPDSDGRGAWRGTVSWQFTATENIGTKTECTWTGSGSNAIRAYVSVGFSPEDDIPNHLGIQAGTERFTRSQVGTFSQSCVDEAVIVVPAAEYLPNVQVSVHRDARGRWLPPKTKYVARVLHARLNIPGGFGHNSDEQPIATVKIKFRKAPA
jgi:hypothetical protein